ncbi:hypothetical protein JL720_15552 [Aureococcus anophagefferens]|nr:hypothetical protein JL720_15552 [Aureococcus anophagefferens]
MAQAFQRGATTSQRCGSVAPWRQGATLSQRCGSVAPRRHRSTLRRAASSVSGLGDLVDDYDVFLLDQYGVLHNGAALFPAARRPCELHAAGKRLVVLSNTSKRRQALVDELPGRGFDAAWLAGAVCSGEVCHGALAALPAGSSAVVLGWADRGAAAYLEGTGVDLAPVEAADVVVAYGPDTINEGVATGFRSSGDLEPYASTLRAARARDLPMYCANPDQKSIDTDGETALFMPGTICDEIIHVGDSLCHDVAGAAAAGVASLFVVERGRDLAAADAALARGDPPPPSPPARRGTARRTRPSAARRSAGAGARPVRAVLREEGQGGSPRPPAPESGEGMSAKAAAKLAAAALARPKKAPAAESAAGAGDDAPAKKPSAKQKIAARRGAPRRGAAEEETPARNSARRKGGSLELEPEDRAKLRGVAAAEDAYNAAELLQEQAFAGSERNGAYDALDASEVAAAQAYFNATLWPSAVLVGLELTSRRGAAKLAEQRGRGAKSSYAASLAASGGAAWTVADSLAELARLCETARVRAVDATFQRADAANGQYLVGKGKIEEVARKVLDHGADAVVFDDELSLAQQRSVLAVLAEAGCDDKVQILDRTQLVLQIFSERAQTREAKAQIALARADGGRGAGGGAYRGAGESQLEMDRRLFARIAKLKAELGAIASKRAVARSKKLDKEDLPLVALIGYTNAGKTSLLNALSEAAPLYADDRLFATLDPATRRVTLPSGRACKLTDTVGFIQKLPTKLVASFRDAEEIADACAEFKSSTRLQSTSSTARSARATVFTRVEADAAAVWARGGPMVAVAYVSRREGRSSQPPAGAGARAPAPGDDDDRSVVWESDGDDGCFIAAAVPAAVAAAKPPPRASCASAAAAPSAAGPPSRRRRRTNGRRRRQRRTARRATADERTPPPSVPAGPCPACRGRHVRHTCGKVAAKRPGTAGACPACRGRHVRHTCGKAKARKVAKGAT